MTRLRNWFFPSQIEISPAVRSVLEIVFPTLDLTRVSFHHGLPHLFHLLGCGGLALPASWGRGRSRLYLARGHYRPHRAKGLSLLLHETFHALQMQQLSGLRGWGLFDPFLGLYVACSAGVGFRYSRHPLEHDAYEYFGGRHGRFECDVDHDLLPWAKLELPDGALSSDEFERLALALAPAVCRDCGVETGHRFAASIPWGGWRQASPWRRGWTVLAALVWAPLWIVITAKIVLLAIAIEGIGWLLTGGPSADGR